MAGETIVFFPKYTTLVGAAAGGIVYYSDPYEMTGYKTVSAETVFGGAIGSGTISAQMQQSSDLITWSALGSAMAPTSGTPSALETDSNSARYVRLQVTIAGGAGAVVSFWSKAVARDA